MQSLRVKLILPFLAGMLALTLLLTWYTYTSARKAVEDATLLISEAKTVYTASNISLLFKSVSTSMQNMVSDPHVTALFSAERDTPPARTRTIDWLEIITQGNEYYRDILIVDKNGVCIASSNPGHVGNSYIDRPYVKRALDGMFNFGEASVGRVTNRLTVAAAGPVDTAEGVAGALVMLNDLPKIVDYDPKTTHGEQTIFTAIISPDGVFVAHKDIALMGNEETRFPDLYQYLAKVGEQGGTIEYSMLGNAYVGYARLMSGSNWVVVSSGIKEQVFASAYRVGFMVLGISIISLSLICFIVIRFANGILSSLLSLIRYAKRVSEGDLETQLGAANRTDELGVLHNALKRVVTVLQAMLKETQEANKMKGQFLANMSHEIRTPLNAILGMAHLSLRDGGLPDKQVEYIEKIQLAAKSLLGLINDILDFSKVDAGMLEIERTEMNLRTLLNDMLTLHQENARTKGIALRLEYQPGSQEFFFGDPLRIGQVVNNLVSNAMKFTREGSVLVRCWQEAGQSTAASATMHVSVTDSGIGISRQVLATLFKPFTQADASITRQFGGTGLGLAISDKIVHLMGGAFTVTSEPGKGSTFSFSMQLEINAAGALAQEQEQPLGIAFEQLRLGGKRILVAEDNDINQMIMQELLAPTGASVTMADNGEKAVEAVKKQDFDLIFMDMQMPIMDGLEATRIIRSLKKTQNIPIIAVTANAMKESKDKGFASGMSDYLTKPIEPKQLLQMLRTWL